MSDSRWTLSELNERVRDALASGYVPASNARVRAVPDRRTIRYYTTLGLIDRAELRGRTAYYDQRHLLQIVAIKRLQAEGLTLTQVQERLAGLSDLALDGLAKLPEETQAPRARRRESFWEDAPAAVPTQPPANTGVEETPGAPSTYAIAGLRLGEGVTLLLPGGVRLGPDDVQHIERAAAPLLHALRTRGILEA